MSDFYTQFRRFVEERSGVKLDEKLLSSNIVSSEIIEFPKSLLSQVQNFVSATFQLRNLASYQKKVAEKVPQVAAYNPKNFSALMSYDFHVDEHGKPRLVEINTNAAFSLVLWCLFSFHKLKGLTQFDQEIVQTFESEWKLVSNDPLHNVLIIDDRPTEQKLYVEFLLYQSLFRKHGWHCEIKDSKNIDLSQQQLIYNRDTDFYLTATHFEKLQTAYTAQKVALSPNPHEYALLADKERLLEFADAEKLQSFGLSEGAAQTIAQTTLKVFEVKNYDPEELWSMRKKLFFKPKRSFGSKAVYRGNSISHGVFQTVRAQDYLAQEFVPPGEITFKSGEKIKFDLRFYVYRDKIQLVGARLFQGQVTNFQSPGGGFAPVVFV